MEINAVSTINHPLDRVYLAYRDELPRIATYVNNIKGIKVLAREELSGKVKLHNEWTGRGEIPKVAQGLVKPEMLSWDDYAEWSDAEHIVRWNLKIRVFSDKFRCTGTNRLSAEGPNRTRVHLVGQLDLDLREIPGVPRFLASSIAPQVEKFIVALVKPNLEEVNVAIGRYLDSGGKLAQA